MLPTVIPVTTEKAALRRILQFPRAQENENAMIGFIRGAMIIAPIITAALSAISPRVARVAESASMR